MVALLAERAQGASGQTPRMDITGGCTTWSSPVTRCGPTRVSDARRGEGDGSEGGGRIRVGAGADGIDNQPTAVEMDSMFGLIALALAAIRNLRVIARASGLVARRRCTPQLFEHAVHAAL